MKYSRLAGLLIGTAAAFGFSGAAFAEVTLSFLHKWPEPENMAYFEPAVAEFEAANPDIKIKMEAVADEPYKDKIRVLMGSNEVPDVFFSWSGEFGKNFSRNGRALDITDAVYGGDWKASFPEAALEPFKYEGKLYGVPINVDAKFMLYNKKLFADNGIGVPATYEDFVAACHKLKDAGIEPIAFGNQYPWAASHYIGELNAKLVPNEVRLDDYNLTSPADTLYTHPGYTQALADFQKLNDDGCFNRGSNALTHSIARGSFLAGRNAMMYMELVEFNQVTADSQLGQDGWGFFPLPPISGGAGDPGLLTGAPDGFMISAATEHPDEAIRFLKFLTSAEQAQKYVKITGMTSSVNGSVTPDNASEQAIEGLKAIDAASGLALWLDTDMDARSTEVLLAGSQALLNGTDTPDAIMARVRETALAVQKERGN
ncbi:MAG: extracellular solute-binding protein [Rhodobacteraceae bacterium]|nr:extracellular solute-binding protein [Paracoccaceae bacterium]